MRISDWSSDVCSSDLVASKGLDRNDSPNIDINWTDGVHLDMPIAGGWRCHVIGQYRHRKGSGAADHAPLDFTDPGSRGPVFLRPGNSQRVGPVTKLKLSPNWTPADLAHPALATPPRAAD